MKIRKVADTLRMCANALVEELEGLRLEAHWDGSLANTGFLERIPGLPVVSEFHGTEHVESHS